MATQMVRLSMEAHCLLAELARESGLSRQAVMDRALEHYRRERMFSAMDEAYARLQSDPAERAHHEREMRDWDGVVADRLGGAPYDA
jgi:predicted transcriptional regulator